MQKWCPVQPNLCSRTHGHMTPEEHEAYIDGVYKELRTKIVRQILKDKIEELNDHLKSYDDELHAYQAKYPNIDPDEYSIMLAIHDNFVAQTKASLSHWNRLWRKAYPRKYDQDEINLDVVRSIPFQEVAIAYDFKPRQISIGKSAILCPFHIEKTPSFTIFPENHAHCFGCSWHGDAIKFVRELDGCSFPDACKKILSI